MLNRYYIYKGGDKGWMELDLERGKLHGSSQPISFVFQARGALHRLPDAVVLQELRNHAAGRPSRLRLGPVLPSRRSKDKRKKDKLLPTITPHNHDKEFDRLLDLARTSVTTSNHNIIETVAEINVHTSRRRDPQTVAKVNAHTPRRRDPQTVAEVNAHITRRKDPQINSNTTPKHTGNVVCGRAGSISPKTRKVIQQRAAACIELDIAYDDVACLRRYLAGAGLPPGRVDMELFDEDPDYRNRILYHLNPLVKLCRMKSLERYLGGHDGAGAGGLSQKEFAASLGLAHVASARDRAVEPSSSPGAEAPRARPRRSGRLGDAPRARAGRSGRHEDPVVELSSSGEAEAPRARAGRSGRLGDAPPEGSGRGAGPALARGGTSSSSESEGENVRLRRSHRIKDTLPENTDGERVRGRRDTTSSRGDSTEIEEEKVRVRRSDRMKFALPENGDGEHVRRGRSGRDTSSSGGDSAEREKEYVRVKRGGRDTRASLKRSDETSERDSSEKENVRARRNERDEKATKYLDRPRPEQRARTGSIERRGGWRRARPRAAHARSVSAVGGGMRTYSALEDRAIVRWVLRERGREHRVNGNQLWRRLEAEFVDLTGQGRTWMSLRNRYLRYILPALSSSALDPRDQRRLRSAAAVGEIQRRKQRRNSIFDVSPVLSASSRRAARAPRSRSASPAGGSARAPPPPSPPPRARRRPSPPSYAALTRAFSARRAPPAAPAPPPASPPPAAKRRRLYNPSGR